MRELNRDKVEGGVRVKRREGEVSDAAEVELGSGAEQQLLGSCLHK